MKFRLASAFCAIALGVRQLDIFAVVSPTLRHWLNVIHFIFQPQWLPAIGAAALLHLENVGDVFGGVSARDMLALGFAVSSIGLGALRVFFRPLLGSFGCRYSYRFIGINSVVIGLAPLPDFLAVSCVEPLLLVDMTSWIGGISGPSLRPNFVPVFVLLTRVSLANVTPILFFPSPKTLVLARHTDSV